MSFTSQNRALPLWETVDYGGVPIFRALALALDHAAEDGARFALYSADRRDAVLAKFNTKYGANLHGQQYLYDHQHDPGFYPANRPDTSSHCLCADGNPAYRVGNRIVPPTGKLPNFFLGIDAADMGPGARQNDCSMLIGHLERLGYHVTRPYHSGAEAHHFCFTADPAPVLRHWKRIPAPAQASGTAKLPIAVKPKPAKPTPKPKLGPAPVALSPNGAQFIAEFEGFVAKLYNDAATPPNATIGFGHLVHPGPVNGKEPAQFKQGITRDQALKLLQKDAQKAADAVRACVKVPLSQPQFDALVSFTFNCGTGSFESSTLLKKVNAKQFDAVPGELAKWVKAGNATLPGLVRRRTAEAQLFTQGTY